MSENAQQLDDLNSQLKFPKRPPLDKEMPILKRKQTGSFYTADSLTFAMAAELIESLPPDKSACLYDLRFLEPCVGNGSFVFAYLAAAGKFGFTAAQYEKLLGNIYVCDTNAEALAIYKNTLSALAFDNYGIVLSDEYYAEHVGGALLFDLVADDCGYISIDDVFGKGFENSFDIIITDRKSVV